MKAGLIHAVIVFAAGIFGCSPAHPGSKAYAPEPGTYESDLFSRATATLFPDDVRKDPKGAVDRLIRWSGIVKASRLDSGMLVTDYEHHYWDWVEDFGIQRERAFVSPRGEGGFRCAQELSAFGGAVPPLPKQGSLAVVYGYVTGLERDGTVSLRCAPFIKTMPKALYSTEIWDYGRAYLLQGDKSDFKILRVPGPLR